MVPTFEVLEIMMDFLNDTQQLQKYLVSKALLLGNMNIIPYMHNTNKLYLKNVKTFQFFFLIFII